MNNIIEVGYMDTGMWKVDTVNTYRCHWKGKLFFLPIWKDSQNDLRFLNTLMVTALIFCASYLRVRQRVRSVLCVHARVLFLLILTFKHIYIVHKQADAKTLEFKGRIY